MDIETMVYFKSLIVMYYWCKKIYIVNTSLSFIDMTLELVIVKVKYL